MIYESADTPSTTSAQGVDALVLVAITDLNEAWYGMTIDKKAFRIVLEDETEDTVYLKIVKIQQEKE